VQQEESIDLFVRSWLFECLCARESMGETLALRKSSRVSTEKASETLIDGQLARPQIAFEMLTACGRFSHATLDLLSCGRGSASA
jgi:hypothetical protein